RPGLNEVAVTCERLEPGAELLEHRRRDVEPADDTRLLEQDACLTGRVLVDRGQRGRVTGADVLGQPGAHVQRGQLHRSSSTFSSFRITVCAAKRSSSNGKSVRKWPPRLSRRARALFAISLASVCGLRASRSSPTASRISPASRHISARNSAVTVSIPAVSFLATVCCKAGSGSDTAAIAARRPKTRHSSREFDASRLAP